ncbi:MAG: type II toxin-antitoxin system HicA family toxin [Planctomycetota bacterium]
MSYKRVKIIRALKEYGFEFLREGGNHTIFTNGKVNIPVGRHKEISPKTAQKIAKEINITWTDFMTKIN